MHYFISLNTPMEASWFVSAVLSSFLNPVKVKISKYPVISSISNPSSPSLTETLSSLSLPTLPFCLDWEDPEEGTGPQEATVRQQKPKRIPKKAPVLSHESSRGMRLRDIAERADREEFGHPGFFIRAYSAIAVLCNSLFPEDWGHGGLNNLPSKYRNLATEISEK